MAEATIRDVARRAEVSVASVSRALNGLKNVGPDTRARVIAAASELGYVPHAGARSLSLARSHAIGVVLPDLHGEFFSELVRGMDREASQRGYLLLLSNMHADRDQASGALRAMRGRVDGLLVMAPHIDPDFLDAALPRGLPTVCVNCPGPVGTRPSMRLDNYAGVEAVIRHLVEHGYRRVAHVAGPEGNIDARERLDGYRSSMGRHAPDSPLKIIQGDFTEEAGEAAARELLQSGDVDAVFAANDMMALGLLQGLQAAGVPAPQGMAVVGFDDVPLARYVGLSTVRVRIADIGARAVLRLVDLFEDRAADEPEERILPELVGRATSAPLAGAPSA